MPGPRAARGAAGDAAGQQRARGRALGRRGAARGRGGRDPGRDRYRRGPGPGWAREPEGSAASRRGCCWRWPTHRPAEAGGGSRPARRGLPAGLRTPVAKPLPDLVLDGGLRQPVEDPQLPAPATATATAADDRPRRVVHLAGASASISSPSPSGVVIGVRIGRVIPPATNALEALLHLRRASPKMNISSIRSQGAAATAASRSLAFQAVDHLVDLLAVAEPAEEGARRPAP